LSPRIQGNRRRKQAHQGGARYPQRASDGQEEAAKNTVSPVCQFHDRGAVEAIVITGEAAGHHHF
jgi:hypothetical protein